MSQTSRQPDTSAARKEAGERAPKVSIGIPVRNGAATLPRALDSLLSQTFTDFEIVISDNASDDRTAEVCRTYADRDGRVRYFCNERNIGQIGNFNRVFALCRGEYMRWAGCNDWWDPRYLERCVEALDARPEAVLATCYQKHYDDGRCFYEEYTGPRPDSDRLMKRFLRTLWFFRRSRYYIDPVYSLMRRSALERTSLFPSMMGTDLVLAAEMSLIGPFVHVPECLSCRRITPEVPQEVLAARFDPAMAPPRWRNARITAAIGRRVWRHPMSRTERAVCLAGVGNFWLRKSLRFAYWRTRGWLGKATGYRAVKAWVHKRRSADAASPQESAA